MLVHRRFGRSVIEVAHSAVIDGARPFDMEYDPTPLDNPLTKTALKAGVLPPPPPRAKPPKKAPKSPVKAADAAGKKTKVFKYRPHLMDRKHLVEEFTKLEARLRAAESRIMELEDGLLQTDQQTEQHHTERQHMMKLERVLFHTLTRMQAFLMQVVAVSEGNKRAEIVSKSIQKAEAFITERLDEERAGEGGGGGVDGAPPWINEGVVTAYVEVANGISREIESALFGEMQQKCELMAERLTQHANQIEEDVASARQKEMDMLAHLAQDNKKTPELAETLRTLNMKNAELQARLDELQYFKWKERQEVLEAHLELRSFRDEVMKLLNDLTQGITKKMGFIPFAARKEINHFILRAEELEARFPEIDPNASDEAP
jgi:hypothetical protein